jgi:hypothetical protein
MTPSRPARLRCRQIGETDLVAVGDLLARGFPDRSTAYWAKGLARLAQRPATGDYPRFGYMLESDGRTVGVILLIFSSRTRDGATAVRCNVSSWFVEPEFRSYASMMISAAIKHRDVTYINVSPAAHTRATIENQGFRRFTNGQFYCLPAFGRRREPAKVVRFDAATNAPLPETEKELLEYHAGYGCDVLLCTIGGQTLPFVFLRRTVFRARLSAANLVYCRDIGDFARCAVVLGRFLARRGLPFVMIDMDEPIAGVTGRYFDDTAPKYFRGPQQPQTGDLAFTEAILFGP